MELLRVRQIQLFWNRDGICARLGLGDREYPAGFGATVPEALRNLANAIAQRDIKVWDPRAAKPYTENGVQNIACPECGAIHASDFDHVIAFVCDECGEELTSRNSLGLV
jgi:hypothetical protein